MVISIIVAHLLLRVLDGHLGQNELLRWRPEGGARVHQQIRWRMKHHLMRLTLQRMMEVIVVGVALVRGRRWGRRIVTVVRACRLMRNQVDVFRRSRINVPWGRQCMEGKRQTGIIIN